MDVEALVDVVTADLLDRLRQSDLTVLDRPGAALGKLFGDVGGRYGAE